MPRAMAPSLALLLSLLALPLAPAAAQEVMLRLHPRVGDTLHTRLEQQTEISVAGRAGARARSVTTSVVLDARSIVQGSLPQSTIVLTVVDSADLHTTDAHGAAQVAEAERTLRGRRMVLRVAADGMVESAQDEHGGAVSRGMADALASMPAVLPGRPVAAGDHWTREMPLPAGGPLGTRGSAHVNAVFHLDSLSRGGRLAFISLKGDVVTDGASQGMDVDGSIAGAMQVDLVRGWMTDSRFSVLVRTLVTPPAASGVAPMRFVTRVTQRLRTMDKR